MKTKCLLLAVAALGGLFTAVSPAFAQSWTLSDAPTEWWRPVASSADGSHLVAVAIADPSMPPATLSGTIYTSIDSGATWTLTSAPVASWTSVASSADGSKLVAVSESADGDPGDPRGLIYTSTDSGATWTATSAPRTTWEAVASSADGTKLVAADGANAPIYTSSNSGGTWRATSAPHSFWSSLASSADGTHLLAAAVEDGTGNGPGRIYRSSNSGATWTLTSPNAGGGWLSVASSADGSKLAAVGFDIHDNGLIYISSDSGGTWVTNAPAMYWTCVACSADGSKLVAGTDGGPLYTSTNSGATWTSSDASIRWWWSTASSADGSKLVATVYNGGIYTWQSTPAPLLRVSPSGTNVVISWTVPSLNFVLQQNSDLATTNWTDVTTAPTVTNLQNQVVLPAPTGNAFYRLLSQ
jgi:hypothetical protein